MTQAGKVDKRVLRDSYGDLGAGRAAP
jgi:hypothetical protein